MTIQSASDAKTASDDAPIRARDILTSLTMTIINNKITAESTKTNVDYKTFKTSFDLKALITGKIVEIVQSDGSIINLIDLEQGLIEAGYRVSCRSISATREGANDKLKLQVAWG